MFANTKSRNLAQEVCYGFFEKRKNPEKMVCSKAPFFVNASVCFHLAKTVSERIVKCVLTTSCTLTPSFALAYNLPCSDPI